MNQINRKNITTSDSMDKIGYILVKVFCVLLVSFGVYMALNPQSFNGILVIPSILLFSVFAGATNGDTREDFFKGMLGGLAVATVMFFIGKGLAQPFL